MKNFVLNCLLVLNFVAYGQSDFENGFESGFKNGYCYSNQSSVYCNTPIPPLAPLPQINESRYSFQDGYNRGFLYGQDRRKQDNNYSSINNVNSIPQKFSNYTPQNPTELMRIVGMSKQHKFNERTNWTQQRIYQLTDLISSLFNKQNLPTLAVEETRNIYILRLNNYIKSTFGADYGDDYQFRNIVEGYNSVEKSFYESYNSCLESEEKWKLEKEAKELNSTKIQEYDDEKKITSKFLAKNEGEYCCVVTFFKLENKKYVKTLTRNGFLQFFENDMIYVDDQKDCDGEVSITFEDNSMVLGEEVFDQDKLEFSYYAKEVVIDYDFKHVTIYSTDKKTARVFTITRRRG